jgi:hypothetical protein
MPRTRAAQAEVNEPDFGGANVNFTDNLLRSRTLRAVKLPAAAIVAQLRAARAAGHAAS